MPAMTCPRCDGDIEYEMERVDSGDGPWVRSGWVGVVTYTEFVQMRAGTGGRTTCGCLWTREETEALDDQATELAGEWTVDG